MDNLIQLVSIIGAAVAVSFGGIGPALGEGRAVACWACGGGTGRGTRWPRPRRTRRPSQS